MFTLMSVALLGVLVIVGLALGVGQLDAASRRDAWRRIADGRRVLAAHERALIVREAALADQQENLRNDCVGPD